MLRLLECTQYNTDRLTKFSKEVISIKNLIDKKFAENKSRYVIQCLGATFAIMAILSFLNVFTQTALIASLGASTFIVFAMPSAYSAQPRGILGGYSVGLVIGSLFGLIARSPYIATLPFSLTLEYTLFSSLAVGLTIFVMVITNTEHPPAAGLALGLVLNTWNMFTLTSVVVAVLLLAGLKVLLAPYLIDLH